MQQRTAARRIKNQGQIVTNFKKYLTSKESEELIKSFDIGLCVGLAICHGAMRQINSLVWWENALIEFVNWDGSEKSLNEEIIILGQKSPNPILRKKLFNIILHYVVQAQADYECGFNLKSQSDITTPGMPYLVLRDENNKELSIKQREILACHLEPEDLDLLLKPELLATNMVLIHYRDHVIEVSFNPEMQLWEIYDGNYSHESKEKLTKHYLNKEEFIAEIFNISLKVGSPVTRIEACSFEANNDAIDHFKKASTNFLKAKGSALFKDGLDILLSDTPENFEFLLTQVQTQQDKELLFKGLNRKYTDTSAWYHLFLYKPKLVPTVLSLLENSPEIAQEVLTGINDIYPKTKQNAIFLLTTPKIDRETTEKIFLHLANLPNFADNVVKALLPNNITDFNALSYFSCNKTWILTFFLKMFSCYPKAYQEFIRALNEPAKDGITPLIRFKHCASDDEIEAVNLILNTHQSQVSNGNHQGLSSSSNNLFKMPKSTNCYSAVLSVSKELPTTKAELITSVAKAKKL